jgi:uncharacterized protein (DUF1330 family)
MAAYLISDVTVRNAEAFQTYRTRAAEAIAKYGGRYLARGGEIQALEGVWNPRNIIIVEFLSLEQARSRSATKVRANSIASTGDSLAGPQFAISRPCETAKSWRSLPLNTELLGRSGAACSRLSQTGLRALALIESLKTIWTESARLVLKNAPGSGNRVAPGLSPPFPNLKTDRRRVAGQSSAT